MHKNTPSVYIENVYAIDFNLLREFGIMGIVFDVDNTLVPKDMEDPNNKFMKLINETVSKGFKVALITKNRKIRAIHGKNENITAPKLDFKSFKTKLYKAMLSIGTNSCNTVVIGDQIFTEIIEAKRCSVMTILVKPMKKRKSTIKKLKPGIEFRYNRKMRKKMLKTAKK